MKTRLILFIAMMAAASSLLAQDTKARKVFISVDMEGITGVVNWEDVSRDGKDYDYFRTIMTKEVNAAIQGAIEGGATEVLVRDGHGSARNVLPELLDARARLLRGWSGGFITMMAGLDSSFDCVLYVGYHAKAGTPNAILEHTSSDSKITDVSINGVSLPEAGINALVAGYYNVPVVFAAGDKALCEQVRSLLGDVVTVAVKEGVGDAALSLQPEVSRERIREGVKRALLSTTRNKPFTMKSPYTLVLKLKDESMVHEKSFYPGVKRTGDWELTYQTRDLVDLFRAWYWMH